LKLKKKWTTYQYWDEKEDQKEGEAGERREEEEENPCPFYVLLPAA
jgi:hypothetical protein